MKGVANGTMIDNAGKKITISYAATLDKTAAVNTEYELSVYVTDDSYRSTPSAVKVQTCGFNLTRTNEKGTKLADVWKQQSSVVVFAVQFVLRKWIKNRETFGKCPEQ